MAQDSISPILRLPNELIVAIAAFSQSHLQFCETEIVLSHVCRRFRHTVTGASTLWTEVYLNLDCQGAINLSQLYFERSTVRELSVTLQANHNIEARSLRYFIPNINRVSRVFIACLTSQALEISLAPFQIHAVPCLQKLEIENTSDDVRELTSDLFPLGAPKLSSVSFSFCSPRPPLPQWMGAVTHLELKDGPFTGLWHLDVFQLITTRLPSLIHLYLDLTGVRYPTKSGIACQYLTHLHLEFGNSDGAHEMLHTLTSFNTPALTHLDIICSHGDQISVFFNSHKTTRSSGLSFPALTSLSFTNKGCDCGWDADIREDFQSISSPPLQLLPALSSLTLVKQCFTARILSETCGPNSPPWPLLRSITLWPSESDMDDVYVTLQEIVQWKRDRHEAVPRFKLCPSLISRGNWAANGVDVEPLEKL